MLKAEYALYLGTESDEVNVEFVVGDNFFVILEITGGIEKSAVKDILSELKEAIEKDKPEQLKDFVKIVDEYLEKLSEATISLASGLLVEDVLYLVTRGKGMVMLQRGRQLNTILEKETTASGELRADDVVIFTTPSFIKLVDRSDLSAQLYNKHAKEIVDELTPRLKEKDDLGAIAVFVHFERPQEEPESVEIDESREEMEDAEVIEEVSGTKLSIQFEGVRHRLSYYAARYSGRRRVTFIAVAILFVILLWSVVFGYQRRARGKLVVQVVEVSQEVDNKLQEAQDLFGINTPKALALLQEVKGEVVELEKSVGEEKIKEFEELKKRVAQAESTIKKEKEVSAEEFFNLNLIKKGAVAKSLFLERDLLALLNSTDGQIYTLSLSKKSTNTIKGTSIKTAEYVALSSDEAFYIRSRKGVYSIVKGKAKLQVKEDKWGKVKGFWMFNGNMYVFDTGEDEIYRYLVAEKGYGGKSSYFAKGQAVDLEDARDFAIDGSIYILFPRSLMRFTSGLRDGFTLGVPDKDVDFEQLYTDRNLDRLYLLDEDSGRVFIFSKGGEYIKQLSAPVFSKADDFVVSEDEGGIFVLVKDIIYKIKLE